MSLAPHGGTTAKKAGKLQRKYKFQAAKYKLSGFSSYKDGTFRIVVKDKNGKLHSKPLSRTDRINFHHYDAKYKRNQLVKKYFK